MGCIIILSPEDVHRIYEKLGELTCSRSSAAQSGPTGSPWHRLANRVVVHHRVSQCWEPLNPNQKCEKLWTLLKRVL